MNDINIIEESKPIEYEVYLIRSQHSTLYYIFYRKKSNQFSSQILQSYINCYRRYMNKTLKKWNGLYALIQHNDIGIKRLIESENEEEIKKYIDEFILNDEMNDCKKIEKQDIIKLEQINTIKRGKMSDEDKKKYHKTYYLKQKNLKEKQDYYKVNCEKRKQYQKQRYQKIKEQLDELKKLKKKNIASFFYN
jgi:hypothetical protein